MYAAFRPGFDAGRRLLRSSLFIAPAESQGLAGLVRVRHYPAMENVTKTLEELRKLPVDRRIQLVEDLWDTIADGTLGESIAVSPELAEELERRLREYRSAPASARPVEDVLARLRGFVRDRTW